MDPVDRLGEHRVPLRLYGIDLPGQTAVPGDRIFGLGEYLNLPTPDLFERHVPRLAAPSQLDRARYPDHDEMIAAGDSHHREKQAPPA
jgi:hypothetical protein